MSLKRNALRLGSTKAISILLMAASFPVIANFYSPEEVGLQALYISLIMLLMPVSCLRLELALVVEKKDVEAGQLLILCCISTLLISLASLAMASLVFWIWPNLASGISISLLMLMIPLNFVFEGFLQALNGISTRVGNVSAIAAADLLRSIVFLLYPILIALANIENSVTLLQGYLFGSIAGVAVLSPVGFKFLSKHGVSANKLHNQPLKKHAAFITYGSWGAILNGFATQLPIIIMGSFFGREVLGYISAAKNILKIPLRIGSSAVSRALFIELSQETFGSEKLFVETKRSLAIINIILTSFILLAPVSNSVFKIILGEEWSSASTYYIPLLLLYTAWSFTSPLSILFNVLRRQKELFVLQLLKLLARVLSLVGGYHLFGIEGTILIYVLISTAAQLLQLFTALRISGADALLTIFFMIQKLTPTALIAVFLFLVQKNMSDITNLIAWVGLSVTCMLYQLKKLQ